MIEPGHFVSVTLTDVGCHVCNNKATHKIREEIAPDDMYGLRHPLTTYLCCHDFSKLMGPAARQPNDPCRLDVILG